MVLRRRDFCVAFNCTGDLDGDLDFDFLMVGERSGDFCSIDLSRSLSGGTRRSIFRSGGTNLSMVLSSDPSFDLSFDLCSGDLDDLVCGDF